MKDKIARLEKALEPMPRSQLKELGEATLECIKELAAKTYDSGVEPEPTKTSSRKKKTTEPTETPDAA